jgi:hypothetical protein
LKLITAELLLDERLKTLAERTNGTTTIDDKINHEDRDNMSKPTKNLTAPYAVRLRHDQKAQLDRVIKYMTEEELEELVELDRSKFTENEKFKNFGRASNPSYLILRAALDEYLKKFKRPDQLELFQ